MHKQNLLTPAEEAKLLQGIREKDERALRRLMVVVAAYLVGVARSVLDNLQDSEEVVQDVLFEFWNKSADVELRSGLVPYLAVSVRNRAISRRRKYGSEGEQAILSLSEDEWNTVPDDSTEQTAESDASETILAVLERTQDLPKKQGEVIAYRLAGLSVADIAKKMGISAKGVEINITRAFHALRKMFSA